MVTCMYRTLARHVLVQVRYSYLLYVTSVGRYRKLNELKEVAVSHIRCDTQVSEMFHSVLRGLSRGKLMNARWSVMSMEYCKVRLWQRLFR
jgi:hypothetical protein